MQRNFPHSRGGVSFAPDVVASLLWFSPLPWGCFSSILGRHLRRSVFPTHAGVFQPKEADIRYMFGFPHARGGVSEVSRCYFTFTVFSPRTWGCFRRRLDVKVQSLVFPTSVGVFPGIFSTVCVSTRFPHERGGVSIAVILP